MPGAVLRVQNASKANMIDGYGPAAVVQCCFLQDNVRSDKVG